MALHQTTQVTSLIFFKTINETGMACNDSNKLAWKQRWFEDITLTSACWNSVMSYISQFLMYSLMSNISLALSAIITHVLLLSLSFCVTRGNSCTCPVLINKGIQTTIKSIIYLFPHLKHNSAHAKIRVFKWLCGHVKQCFQTWWQRNYVYLGYNSNYVRRTKLGYYH